MQTEKKYKFYHTLSIVNFFERYHNSSRNLILYYLVLLHLILVSLLLVNIFNHLFTELYQNNTNAVVKEVNKLS